MRLFPVDLAFARIARNFVHATVSDWGLLEAADCARLIASELVTNAVLAWVAEGADREDRFKVAVSLEPDFLVIGVWDRSRKGIRMSCPDETDEHGRGLLIVRELAAAVGMTRGDFDTKCVWAKLALEDC
ncbi:ATP-binding protein [Streptacidiphilus sp. 4-A2]|nr:ATP-binding protein [Streptacidiphilus sp. 4-A2]